MVWVHSGQALQQALSIYNYKQHCGRTEALIMRKSQSSDHGDLPKSQCRESQLGVRPCPCPIGSYCITGTGCLSQGLTLNAM